MREEKAEFMVETDIDLLPVPCQKIYRALLNQRPERAKFAYRQLSDEDMTPEWIFVLEFPPPTSAAGQTPLRIQFCSEEATYYFAETHYHCDLDPDCPAEYFQGIDDALNDKWIPMGIYDHADNWRGSMGAPEEVLELPPRRSLDAQAFQLNSLSATPENIALIRIRSFTGKFSRDYKRTGTDTFELVPISPPDVQMESNDGGRSIWQSLSAFLKRMRP